MFPEQKNRCCPFSRFALSCLSPPLIRILLIAVSIAVSGPATLANVPKHLHAVEKPHHGDLALPDSFECKRTVTHDDQPAKITKFAYSDTGAAMTTTVTGPDGVAAVYSYSDPLDLAHWDRGLVRRIDVTSLGSAVERVWDRNRTFSLGGSDNTASRNNPYVKTETRYVDGESAVVDLTVDKNGNPLTANVHDWASKGGSLSETTNTYWVVTLEASDASDSAAAYWSPEASTDCGPLARLDAVKSSEVRKGNTVKAVAGLEYDCPYTSGNVTREWHWDSRQGFEPEPACGNHFPGRRKPVRRLRQFRPPEDADPDDRETDVGQHDVGAGR